MRNQMDAIRETPWDLLVVLDACRADYFGKLVSTFERVETPGRNTPAWFAHAAPILAARGVTYYTANPVIDQENEIREHGVRTVSLWERYWGRWGEYNMPTVHPISAVTGYLALSQGVKGPHVLHLMQPHSPYIGCYALPCICGEKTVAVYYPGVPLIADYLADGSVTWDMLRAAYESNLRLAWQAIEALVHQVTGRVAITSDHGEMLGEYDGMIGHSQRRPWRRPECMEVPWLVVDGSGEEADRRKRLAALGYA